MFLFSVQYSFGQLTNSFEKKKKAYIIWVKPFDNPSTFKGYLSEVGDTLVIAPLMVNKPIKKIRLDNVNYLEFREKGKRGRSLLLGGLAGFGIGAIIGYVWHNPSSSFIGQDRTANVILFGQLIAIPGLLIGNAYGRQRIRVPVRGSGKSIQAQKEELRKYKFGG